LLAGTYGDGILRSTDGGRYWHSSNFGLREFAILDLATAPVWERYEYAFVITEGGIYQSPNGGRAWRRVDLARSDVHPLSIAVSSSFAEDRTVFMGSEEGKLFVSVDAGRSWRLAAKLSDPINSLASTSENTLLIGTSSGIYRNVGNNWKEGDTREQQFILSELPSPVMSLDEIGDTLLSGLADGLYESTDVGRSWQSVSGLAARRFVWYFIPTASLWLAAGPEEGVWCSNDRGQKWQQIWEETPVLAMAASVDRLWISTPDGVLTSEDLGLSWRTVFTPDNPMIALAMAGDAIWAGDQMGNLWYRTDEAWMAVDTPFAGTQLLGLFGQGETVAAAVWESDTGMVQLWRKGAVGRENNGDSDWSLWFSQPANPLTPQVTFMDESGREAMIGLGTYLYHHVKGEWQGQRMGGKDAPVTALLALPDHVLVALTDRLAVSVSGDSWTLVGEALEGEAIVSLQTCKGEEGEELIFAGTADGHAWLGKS
jgi:hypothetical protein